VTALLVARPVVLGEDPGMTDELSDAGGLVLNLLWMAAALGWAAWRLLSRKGDWYGGLVEAALLVLVVLVFFSAETAARYKHPARLIAWEWVGLLLAFVVVRQLAARSEDGHALFAALLASAVSLSAYGVYQSAVELPRDQQRYAELDKLRQDMARQHVYLDDAQLRMMHRRLQDRHAFGTFAHPNSYAGYLVLLLPGLAGAVFVCRGSRWPLAAAAGCLALGCVALWLTHSRGAMLGLGIVAVGAAAVARRRALWAHKGVALLTLLVLAGAGAAAWGAGLFTSALGKSTGTAAYRLDYWRATWRMIAEHPWLGVGPGNFAAAYTRYLPAGAAESIRDPHNFALELWATCGVFALLALLAALGVFFVQAIRAFSRAPEASAPPAAALASGARLNGDEPVRWELYAGGMLGLLLGFVLRVQESVPEAILAEALNAGLRSVVWFAAFALFERVAWTDRGRAAALTAGVAALLLNLSVNGGIGFPSVVGPLLVCMALALAALRPAPVAWVGRQRWLRAFPVPVLVGVSLVYLVFVFFPVTGSASAARRALGYGLAFFEDMDRPAGERRITEPAEFMRNNVLGLLREAVQDDPDSARTHILLAGWYGRAYRIFAPHDDRTAQRALEETGLAQQLDPEGRAGYQAEYQLRLDFAEFMRQVQAKEEEARDKEKDSKRKAEHARRVAMLNIKAREQYRLAAAALLRYLPNDPNDPRLRFDVARGLIQGGEEAKGRQEAGEALRLDEAAAEGARRLSAPQRVQIRQWLGEEGSGPDS
jgi:O-antigen ligase